MVVFLKIKIQLRIQSASLQFSHSVVSDSLRPHRLQHARPPCPSPTPRIYSNSCPLSQWCHPTISSSFVPFSSCLQSFPASGSFQMSQTWLSDWTELGGMWNECNCVVVWTFFGISLLWEGQWKLTFSGPVATAEFPKFPGILSEAFYQHYFLGFEIVQMVFHQLHWLCS